MKKDLINLIDSTDRIESLFHSSGTGLSVYYEEINDVQEFQDWLQEIKFELNSIFARTGNLFIQETINLCNTKMNGSKDKKIFRELKGKLRVIGKNINQFYLDENNFFMDSAKNNEISNDKKPLIFISHSSKNKEQVDYLARMLRAINLQPGKDIFCSSLPGYDIPIDTDDRIFDFLRDKFLNNKIHVFFIHSHEYYDSNVSLNEMGAAWVLKTEKTSFLLPGFDFSEMTGVVNDDKIAVKLDNDINEVRDKLNQLRRQLEKEFELESVPDTIWEQAREEFIKKVNQCGIENRGESSAEIGILLKKLSENTEGCVWNYEAFDTGRVIKVGEETVASENLDRRNYAKWEAVLNECVQGEYIKQRSDNSYVLSNKGYEWLDKNFVAQLI